MCGGYSDLIMGPIHMRYKLCVIMYGGGRAMWCPGRGSFLLGSAVVGDGVLGGGWRCAGLCTCNKLVVFDVPYPLLIVTYTTGMHQLRIRYIML